MTSKKRTCGDLTEDEVEIFFGKFQDMWVADKEVMEAGRNTRIGQDSVHGYCIQNCTDDPDYVLTGDTIEKCAENAFLEMRSEIISDFMEEKKENKAKFVIAIESAYKESIREILGDEGVSFFCEEVERFGQLEYISSINKLRRNIKHHKLKVASYNLFVF